ncbi:MAG: pyridoxal phosphate-dependent aminotransferase [Gammaproteobacteria bacterium]|nr:pyridoxal phosphate-dependent aminotransferase [Gammaproteobacteria bacterium]
MLKTPISQPREGDRIMALHSLAKRHSENTGKQIAIAGIGKPTFPANQHFLESIIASWQTLDENAKKSDELLSHYEEQIRQSSDPDKIAREGYPLDLLQEIHALNAHEERPDNPAGLLSARENMASALTRLYRLPTERPFHYDHILFTVGGSSGIASFFMAINSNKPHGRIITPSPYYPLHAGGGRKNRLHTFDVLKLPGYKLNPQVLFEAISTAKRQAFLDGGEISAFVFCYPNNPTGATLSAEEWRAIANIILEDDTLKSTPILLDESYAEMHLDGQDHYSLVEVAPELEDRIVLLRSGTKGMSLAGERVAILACKNKKLLAEIVQAHSNFCGHAPIICSKAYAYAMTKLDAEEEALISSYYGSMVEFVYNALIDIGAAMPDKNYTVSGTFYVLADLSDCLGIEPHSDTKQALPEMTHIIDDETLVKDLIFRKQIMLCPLSYFGVNSKKGYVRITCSDVVDCEYIINQLGDFLAEVRKEKLDKLDTKIKTRLEFLAIYDSNEARMLNNEYSTTFNQALLQYNEQMDLTGKDAKQLKNLQLKLKAFSVQVGAKILCKKPNGELEAAIRITAFAQMIITRARTKKFQQKMDICWYEWVESTLPEKYHVAKKRVLASERLAANPQWRNQRLQCFEQGMHFFAKPASNTNSTSSSDKAIGLIAQNEKFAPKI